ncbi:MAG: hypothetical protein ACFFDU_05385 [Candidatus Thorarchaeota archaeon]
MTEARKIKVVYRRWTILIPIFLIITGIALMYVFWIAEPLFAFLGGMIAFIGVLTFGILIVAIISLELSSRTLKHQRPTPPALSEELEEREANPEEA